jgi:hypothetical protein
MFELFFGSFSQPKKASSESPTRQLGGERPPKWQAGPTYFLK